MKHLNNILLSFIFAALMLTGQPVRGETSTNPLTSRAFWAEMKQTQGWQEIVHRHIDAGWDVNEYEPYNPLSPTIGFPLLILQFGLALLPPCRF